eukprot:117615_1
MRLICIIVFIVILTVIEIGVIIIVSFVSSSASFVSSPVPSRSVSLHQMLNTWHGIKIKSSKDKRTHLQCIIVSCICRMNLSICFNDLLPLIGPLMPNKKEVSYKKK